MARSDRIALVGILFVVATLALPVLSAVQDDSDEKSAWSDLKTIYTAQRDFRSNERDGNNIKDFWTGDIAGLYAIDNSSTGAKSPEPIKLIELRIALADLEPLKTPALLSGNYEKPITTYGGLKATRGYRFLALKKQLAFPDKNGPNYAQDTDTTGDLVHHLSRFGAAAIPEKYGTGAKGVWIINEDNTVYRRDFGSDVLTETKDGVRLNEKFDGNWPSLGDQSRKWSQKK